MLFPSWLEFTFNPCGLRLLPLVRSLLWLGLLLILVTGAVLDHEYCCLSLYCRTHDGRDVCMSRILRLEPAASLRPVKAEQTEEDRPVIGSYGLSQVASAPSNICAIDISTQVHIHTYTTFMSTYTCTNKHYADIDV